ncbi:MAG: hypothetical protein JNL58_17140 [Planctomyces sp.]|nr:hypothetical protein [Planctomyces sp.]
MTISALQYIQTLFRRFHESEGGMMSIANAVCVLLATLLITASLNNMQIANRTVERQNAADAAALSGTVWMARGMNSVTATNHLMGEMLSLVILHEAIGGKKQENKISADSGTNHSKLAEDPGRLKRQDNELQLAYLAALAASQTGLIKAPDEDIFKRVYQRDGESQILAEATLLDSKMNLKKWLTRAYQGLVVAAALKAIPYTRPAGEALEQAMHLLEQKINQEYRTLQALHGIADELLATKIMLRDEMLPLAKKRTTDLLHLIPLLARQTAQTIGEKNGVMADLFPEPGQLQLPLQIDPLSINHQLPNNPNLEVPEPNPNGCDCPSETTAPTWDQVSKMTQLARASFPWVNYHRQPVLDALAATCQLADAKEFYFHWSNGYSKMIVQEQQEPKGDDPNSHLGLYVLKGYEGPDKGYELWNLPEHSDIADNYFTFIGMAWQEAPTVVGSPIFQQLHPDGMFSWSMTMLYNGNEQQRAQHRIDPTCKRIVPIRQANVGMDTLNWFPGSRQTENGCEYRPEGSAEGSAEGENRPFELLGIGIPSEYPRIQVNWQVKLVPTTAHRLNQLRASQLDGPFSAIASKIVDNVPSTMTTH